MRVWVGFPGRLYLLCVTLNPCRFGLLHRIPPQPADRLPGSIPMELQEAHEQQDLFVPADVHSESHFSPERLAEWRRQEQEDWVQETMGARGLYSHPTGDRDAVVPDPSQRQQSADNHGDQPSFDMQDTSRTYSPVAHGQPFNPLTNGRQ